MRGIAITSLVLVLILVSLSAYLRLDHSGIGCTPWPACYGNIGRARDDGGAGDAYERLLMEAQQPAAWATKLHRLIASALGVLIVSLSLLAMLQKRDRLISFSLLFLTVFLAVIGIQSGSLHSPAVVMGNLCGGFAMLGLLGWLVLREESPAPAGDRSLRAAPIAALALLLLQIVTGGFTSANFAASACRTLPDCHGSWLPGKNLPIAFDLSRVHEVGETGFVSGGPERADIHKLHRLTAVLAFLAITMAAVLAIIRGFDLRVIGAVLLLLVAAEFGVGIAAIIAELPIVLAVAHNWLAAILLLVLLRLYARTNGSQASQHNSAPQQL